MLMSRSYKKSPYFTDYSAGATRKAKRIANKKVRKKLEFLNGGFYKKLSESWNIHDYTGRWTWQEAKEAREHNEYLKKRYPTLKSYYRYWLKCCRSK
jgi:hypothetical protein